MNQSMTGNTKRGSGSGNVRIFIALPIPTEVRDELCHAQAELQAGLEGDGMRWTRSEHMHLTIKFLGNIDDRQVDDVIAITTSTCAALPPVQLRAEGFGFFPENRLPRVIWVPVHDEGQQLTKLAGTITGAVERFAIDDNEREFAAHLTIGRIKDMRASEVRFLVDTARGFGDWAFGKWTAGTVEVIRSEMNANGLQYTTLAEIPLLGAK
jgi:RNA 2',3'-cyclic 3'-phosphodiesterase